MLALIHTTMVNTQDDASLEAVTALITQMLDNVSITEIPKNIADALSMAQAATDSKTRAMALAAATRKAEIEYFRAWSKGARPKDQILKIIPMSEEVKAKLKASKAEKKELRTPLRVMPPPLPPKVKTKKPAPKRAGTKKIPVYEDLELQAAKLKAYPWGQAGSFRPDPESPTKTILDIKCQVCGKLREIHFADLFICRFCRVCKALQ